MSPTKFSHWEIIHHYISVYISDSDSSREPNEWSSRSGGGIHPEGGEAIVDLKARHIMRRV